MSAGLLAGAEAAGVLVGMVAGMLAGMEAGTVAGTEEGGPAAGLVALVGLVVILAAASPARVTSSIPRIAESLMVVSPAGLSVTFVGLFRNIREKQRNNPGIRSI